MDEVDLNLLVALDALLADGSVTGAARRLGLSASAMSRTLTRLRKVTGDPLLVRAGRGLVPTPHAASLRARVHELTRDVQSVLRPPATTLDLASLAQTFTIRANPAFVEFVAVPLLSALTEQAPKVRLRFLPKPDKAAAPLREGLIDLEIGVVETTAPELRMRRLFEDCWLGVARRGHPFFDGPAVTVERYAACRHVVASATGEPFGPVDAALAALGLQREVAVVVPGFGDVLRIARGSTLIGLVPRSCLGGASNGQRFLEESGLQAFSLPVRTPNFMVSALWHPRLDTDPAQRWLRGVVLSVCRAAFPDVADPSFFANPR